MRISARMDVARWFGMIHIHAIAQFAILSGGATLRILKARLNRWAITKPRKKTKHGRQYVGSLIRTLAWEWVKFNHPRVAERIKAVAYNDCGLEPPQANKCDPHLTELLKKV